MNALERIRRVESMTVSKPHREQARKLSRPPLVDESFVEYEPDGQVRVTRHKRGIMLVESRTYDTMEGIFKALSELSQTTTRQELEKLCNGLRRCLESSGLPSDRQPHWVKLPDADWQEQPKNFVASKPNPGERWSAAFWTSRINHLTEPLSIERHAGELLFALIELLKRQDIDNHLWHINRLMRTFASFRMATVNELAYAGVQARSGRKLGSKSLVKRGQEISQVIKSCANAFWKEHSALRGDASNTAQAIESAVNAELIKRGLSRRGKAGIRPKTIASYLGKILRG